MLSIGNDIISLAHINMLRTKQVQFYDKVVSPAELELYHTSADMQVPFEIFVWLAWSVKESVFKYLQRHQPDLVFSPRKINITGVKLSAGQDIGNFGSYQYEANSFEKEFAAFGTVRFGDLLLHFRSAIDDELIFTIVDGDDSFRDIWWGVKTISLSDNKSQSAEVRAFLLRRLSLVFPDSKLSISKTSEGCPVILNDTIESGIPVSLTHHRHFVAYSFRLDASA